MSASRLAKETKPISAPAVVLAFAARPRPRGDDPGETGVPAGAGGISAAPLLGERPALPAPAMREWLKAALVASLAVHVFVYLALQLRFDGDLERAAGAAAALSSDGSITIPVEVISESTLPSAETASDASSFDAQEPVPTPPEIGMAKLRELMGPPAEPAPVVLPQANIEMPPPPAPVVLPTREEAARLVLPEDESAPPSPAETADKAEVPAATAVFRETAPLPPPREPIKQVEDAKRDTQKSTPEKPERAKAAPSAPSKAASPSRSAAANSEGQSGAGGVADAGGRAAISSYFARVQAHLLRHRVYPPEARSSGITGVTRVIFSLGRDGRVLSVALAGGSGHSVLDEAALAMVRRASPFPPFPAEIAASRLEMGAPVRFDLR